MTAIILSIGDELTLGQTVDTNSAYLSAQLAAIGCAVVAHVTVADDQPVIERAIARAAGECNTLIITGGLGPTQDDLTRQAVAAVMDSPLELNAQWLERMKEFFRRLGREMPQTNAIQAMIPRGAAMIWNYAGTAAGIAARIGACEIYVLPGVPREMREMFTRDILPALSEKSGGAVLLSRTLHTFGLGESSIAEKISELMTRGRNPSVGTTVAGGVVSLRVNANFSSRPLAQEKLEKTVAACRVALRDIIYGGDEQTLGMVVGAMLKERSLTVATAESCTGGLVAKMLTDIPGSSAYFQRGWITYSNEAKTEMLDVDAALIARDGAVSESVAAAMAVGALRRSRADYSLSITGIAGPDGGTPTKPVGTVCIAVGHADEAAVRMFHFTGDRDMVRDRSAKMALSLLRFRLLGQPTPF